MRRKIFLVLILMFALQTIAYGANNIKLKQKKIEGYNLYEQEMLNTHNEYVDKIVEEIGKIDLTYEEAVMIESIRDKTILYLASPNTIYTLDGEVGLEKLNADILNTLLDINIEVVSIEEIDDTLDRNFETSLKLLDEDKVQLVSKFEYELEENLSSDYVVSDSFSNRSIYSIYLSNNKYVNNDIAYGNDNFAIAEELSFLNDISYFGKQVPVLTMEQAEEQLLNEEIDYYMALEKKAVYMSNDSRISHSKIKDNKIYPSVVTVAKDGVYANLISILNKIYTSTVLLYFDEYNQYLLDFNKIYIYNQQSDNNHFNETIKIGMIEVPSIIEFDGEEWSGYIVDIYDTISNVYDIKFEYIDYTQIGHKQLINDFFSNKIDIIGFSSDIVLDLNLYNLNNKNSIPVDLKEKVSLEYFYLKNDDIEYFEQIPLNKIGVLDGEKYIIYSYIGEYIKGYENVTIYYDTLEMFEDLQKGDIDLVISIDGTEAFLKNNDIFYFSSGSVDVDSNYISLVRVNEDNSGEKIATTLNDLIEIINVQKIAEENLYFKINEEEIITNNKKIERFFAYLIILSAINAYIMYYYIQEKNAKRSQMNIAERKYEDTNFLNRKCFYDDFVTNNRNDVITTVFKIRNYDKIIKYHGNLKTKQIIDKLRSRLEEIEFFELIDIYFIQENEFVINISNNYFDDYETKMKYILSKLEPPILFDEFKEQIYLDILSVNSSDIESNEKIVSFINHYFSNIKKSDAIINYKYLTEEDIKALDKSNQITKLIIVEEDDKNIVVKFKPIMNIETGKIIGLASNTYLKFNDEYIHYREFSSVAKISNKTTFILNKTYNEVINLSKELKKEGIIDDDFIFDVRLTDIGNDFNKAIKEIESYNIEDSNIRINLDEEYLENIHSKEIAKAIKENGFKLSIYEFTAGHSSIENIDVIQFDNVFFSKTFMTNENALEGAFKITNLLNILNCDYVFTNVDTKEQFELLKGKNVKYSIGEYIGKELKLEEVKKYLIEKK